MQHTHKLSIDAQKLNTKESKRPPTCFYSQFGSFAKINFVVPSSHTVTHTVTNTAALCSCCCCVSSLIFRTSVYVLF